MRKRGTRIILIVFALTMLSAVALDLGPAESSNLPVAAPESPPPVNPHLLNLFAEYENHTLDRLAATGTPGIAIAVVRDTSVVYLNTIGLREIGRPDSIDRHSVFRLASVSKCFAPVLTGMLVEEGILHWDDPVVRYLPDFKLSDSAATASLTLRHVLSHTTGLPYHTYTTLIEDGLDITTMLNRLRDVPMASKPGEFYSYQNVAYSIIGEVIHAATGKRYDELMNERIFQPLGMKDASMSHDDILSNPNVARPHRHWKKGWRVTSINDTYYNAGPAGGMNASISDMTRWMKALLHPESYGLITTETLDEIFSPRVMARSRNKNFRRWIDRADSWYGLGWRVLQFDTDTLMYHGGYVNGYRSEIAIDRRNKMAICVLSNGPGSVVDNSIPYFFHLYFNQRDSIFHWETEQMMARTSRAQTKPL